MKRNRTALRVVLGAAVLAGFVGAAQADFTFDFTQLSFTYTRTNAAAGVGEVIGTIDVQEQDDSSAFIWAMLSADGAKISPGTAFNFVFQANVVKGAGANNYTIVSTGGVLASDTNTAVNKVEAGFLNDEIALSGGTTLLFTGKLFTLGGNDSILVNGVGDSWEYLGNQGSPWLPSVGLASGRSDYDSGTFVYLDVFDVPVGSLDAFFTDEAIRAAQASVKLQVVPAPAALLLGAMGLTGIHALRRRIARIA